MNPLIDENPVKIIADQLLEELKAINVAEGQVIVHGLFKSPPAENVFIRIWPTTFLFDKHSDHRSELVWCDKIALFPQWTEVSADTFFTFTLVFTALPSSCTVFDLAEVIPESGGFFIGDIIRTSEDVYYVDFS
jgi:hypothetical protein